MTRCAFHFHSVKSTVRRAADCHAGFFLQLLYRFLQIFFFRTRKDRFRFARNDISLATRLEAQKRRQRFLLRAFRAESLGETCLLDIDQREIRIRREGIFRLFFFAVIVFKIRGTALLIGAVNQPHAAL